MRIAKPILLVSTPVGVGFGIYEAFRLAGGLAFLMIALVAVIGVAMGTVVATVRREKREEAALRAKGEVK
jgi:chorismate synthase